MKKINILSYSAILAFALSITSCGDNFLSVDPSSSVSIDGYYTTKAHIDEAVTASYDPMHWYDYFSGWAALNLVSDCQGDDIFVGGGSTADQGELHLLSQYTATPTSTQSGQKGAWTTSYSGINRSNLVIADAASSNLSDDEKVQYTDEAKTVRAFYYLILWKWWGNVPYYDTNLTYPYIAPQKSEKEIYELITKDLETIITDNKLPMKESKGREGHATKAFAEMLYADFVMYEKDETKYAQALGYMKDIITSNSYKLMDDYSAIWEQSGEWCDESIFEINYFSNGGTRDWGSANAPGGTVLPAMIGIDGLNGSPDYDGGWGFCDVSKEVYDKYQSTDQRRDAGILYMPKYIEDCKVKGSTVSYGGRYQNTGCFLRKYLPRHGGNAGYKAADALNWDNNLRIYRYSETLLNAAELAFRTNNTADAQSYFDKVRQRALGASFVQIPVSLDNILNERRLEFVGEGKRYYDLIRFGKATEVLKAGGYKVLNKDKTAYNVVGIPERPAWTESKKYLPIPQDEIDAAQGTITQNNY